MKGLILSVAVFIVYVLASMILCHCIRPRKPLPVLAGAALAGLPAYALAFWLTAPDLGFLPPAWRTAWSGFDAVCGAGVYLLNCHSYIDFFFGFNGGFSMSMMLAIRRAEKGELRMEELCARYILPDGFDRIYSWRLPRLRQAGLITIEPDTGVCRLTPKGARVARVGWFFKRLLNLAEGG